MAVYRIKRAVLVSNIAYFEVDAGEPFQIGESVTIAGCTTSTFNTTGTVLTAGLNEVTLAADSNYQENWPGISVAITHANIAAENEPATATVTTVFGAGAGTSDIQTYPE